MNAHVDSAIDVQTALVYVMVMMSAADGEMADAEMLTIGELVSHLPVFEGYAQDRLTRDSAACADILNDEEGFETAIALVADAIPDRLTETAYAVACDIAASDGSVAQEELRLLEMLRHRLGVGRLASAAIERGARARWMTLPA